MSIEVNVSVDWLKQVHRDLDACQKVIWLAGCRPQVPNGFDPSYVTDAQARLKEIEARIATATVPGQPVAHKPQTCNGKRCGWCKEGAEPCHYAAPVSEAKPQGVTDEQAAFEAAVAAVNERGWSTSTDLARQIWDAARLNAAPAQQVSLPDERLAAVEAQRDQFLAVAGYYRATLRNVLKDIRDDLVRGGMAPSWDGVAETISVVLSYDTGAPSPAGVDADHVEDVRAMVVPSTVAAYAMGAKGGSVVDAERLAFESWMAGHCWALCAAWDGTGYRCESEQAGQFNPAAGVTRRLWAAWRHRAALAATASLQQIAQNGGQA